MLPLVMVLVALCALSAVGGVLIVRQVLATAGSRDAVESEVGTVRVRAQIGTGSEQVLIALMRELQLPRSSDSVPYGALYVESDAADGLVVRTRSTMDRGLVAPIDVRPGPGRSDVTYAIVRLPRDEDLQAKVLDFEVTLIAALRRIDAGCVVRLSGTTLRQLERAHWTAAPLESRASRP